MPFRPAAPQALKPTPTPNQLEPMLIYVQKPMVLCVACDMQMPTRRREPHERQQAVASKR